MNASPVSTFALKAPSAGNAAQQRLVEALAEYHEAVDSNRPPDRETFLQKYADIRDELTGYLDSFDLIRALAPDLGETSESRCVSADVISPMATLGDFRILRELGRGGMGVVYEAEQLSIGRRVALKVLPFAAMLDKQQLNRFKNEARAAGTLDHPNRVHLLRGRRTERPLLCHAAGRGGKLGAGHRTASPGARIATCATRQTC